MTKFSKSLVAGVCLLLTGVCIRAALTDYGSIPAVAKPPQDQLDANEKLDFHTDKFTGRFAYSVPIEVPPARGGSEPSVALQYNSANKNGWCGVGWELELGYIQRDTRHGVSLFFSGGGRSGTSSYTNSMGFIYSFGGKDGRLIGVTTNDYRPQIDSEFLKFTLTNGYWIVTDKSGRKYNFGETTASQFTNSFGTFRWNLSSITDPNGNESFVTYTNLNGQLYPNRFDYNANANNASFPSNSIYFDLTNRSDTVSSAISGAEYAMTNILGSVRVFAQGQFVRRYQLQYTNSASTGRSLLQKVTEYGTDNTTALPPRTFAYSQQTRSFQSAVGWPVFPETGAGIALPYGVAPANPVQGLIDIDGDGLPDWVTCDTGSPYNRFIVQFNTGNGFTSARYAWSGVANEGGQINLVWNGVDNSTTFGSTGDSVATCTLLDVNGDMLPDRVLGADSTYSVWNHFQVQLNTGAGFGSLAWLGNVSSASSLNNYQTPNTTTSDGEASRSILVDINGDGLPDHVMMSSTASQLDVQLNLGNGNFGPVVGWFGVANDGSSVTSYNYSPRDRSALDAGSKSHVYADLMDMNGDGLPDRILNGGIQLNNGTTGFLPKSTTWGYTGDPEVVDGANAMYTTQIIDMNGDGLPDKVVSSGSTTYTVYFNTGRGFSTTGVSWSGVNTSSDGTTGWNGLQAWDAYGSKIMFMDMNGDGLVDRVERDYTGSTNIVIQFNNGPFPDLLNVASNGIGGYVEVGYEPSTGFNNSDGTRTSRLPFPVYTVTSLTNGDGRGNESITSYAYTNGYYDTTWREFRGFGVVRETDPLGAYTVTWFHQGGGTNASAFGEYNDDLAKAGMPFRIETWGDNDKLYSRTLNKVDEVPLTTNGIYFPFIRQTIQQEFEGVNTTTYRASAVGYAYSAITNNLAASTGNLISQTNYGEVIGVNIPNHTFTVTNTVAPFYRQLTYVSIGGNPDILDRVATDTTSADAAGSVILRQSTNAWFDYTGDLHFKADLICSGSFATSTFGYDAYGNLTSGVNPVGVVSTTDYDSTSATFPVRKYTGSLGDNLIEYSLFDPRSGNVLASTNVAGLVTGNDYDVFFRLTNSAISTVPYGSPSLTREKREYSLGGIGLSGNAAGISTNYIHILRNDPANGAGFHETWTYFDGLSRPIQTRVMAEIASRFRSSNIVYDDRGSVILESFPELATNSAYQKLPASSVTNYVYTEFDPIGRPFRVNPCAKATFTSKGILSGTPAAITGDNGSPTGPTGIGYRDGTSNVWCVVVTNAMGKIHKYNLDAFGRTNQIVEITSGGNFVSSLAYNPVGDLTNLTDSAGNSIAFFHNLLGETVAEADPDRGFWQYGLDAAGRLKVQTDAKTNIILFDYTDPAGRLKVRLSYTPQGVLANAVTNYWDSNLGDSAYTVYPGQLFMTTDSEGWTKHSYDVRGRETNTTRYLAKNGQTYTESRGFDDADREILATLPSNGPTITNIFDTGMNLSQVKQVGGSNTVFYSATGFNALDQLTGATFGNGVKVTNAYYGVSHRLQQITTLKTTNVQSLAYTYLANGNIAGMVDGVYTGAASATLGNIAYDDLDRLLSYTNTSGTFSFAYSSIGNILTNREFGPNNYVYGSIRPHFARSANGSWYTADQNGNVVFRTGQRLDYNADNQMWRVISTNGLLTTFGYAGDGSRLWKSTSTNSLQVWIGSDYEEKNGKILYHIYAGGRQVCTFDSTGTNIVEYYHPDNLTSTSVQTDQNGNPIQHYTYTAFGESRYTQSGSAFPPSRRYTGQILDEDIGVYYYNFRYCDPQIARFLQPDDIIPETGNPQSWNRYAYCLNNPLRFTDPSGHSSGDEDDDNIPLTLGAAHAALRQSEGGASAKLYNKSVAEARKDAAIARAAVEMTPVAGAVNAGYQAITGKDAVDSHKISAGERVLSAVQAAASVAPVALKAGAVIKEAAATAETIEGASAASRAVKAVNLPAWKKVAIDMAHIADRHIPGGPFTAGRDIFPENMSKDAVEGAIRQAYRYGKQMKSQGERVLMQGPWGKRTIEMWLNRTTKTIETAYPISK